MTFLGIGSLLAAVGVVLGAFGAHALRSKLAVEKLAIFQTGVQYQMYHSIGLILIGTLDIVRPSSWFETAGWAMFVGILLFSGSLYGLSMKAIRILGPLTPLGGLLLILGWISFFVGVLAH